MSAIITHPGSAHMDDFLSVCLVIAKFKEIKVIYRKNPTEEEINNSEFWKLDIGHGLDPKRHLFDHHQEDEDGSTLSLILKHWGIWYEAIEVYPQLPTLVLMDTSGPKKVAQSLNISLNAINKLDSIIERQILRLFSKKVIIRSSSGFFKIMKFLGKSFFSLIEEYFALKPKIEESIEVREIKGVPVTFCLGEDLENSDVLFQLIMNVRKEQHSNIKGGILVFPNNRPLGSIGLRRMHDDRRVDFTKIEKSKGYEATLFVHKHGFFAAVSKYPTMNWNNT